MSAQRGSYRVGLDVDPRPGNDAVAPTTPEANPAVGVAARQISGVQPTFGIHPAIAERISNVIAAHQNLTVVSQTHLDSR